MKKSFIIHVDSLGVLDELSDEQAGQLFKLIYEFHNPKKPNTTQITQVVSLAFHSFKNQFQRDLQTYNNVCERNKSNGMLGGRPKKNNPKKPKKPDSDSDSDSKNDNKKNKILFKHSPIFDKQVFAETFKDWNKDKLKYYYESVLTWSNEGNRKIDWVATIRNWAARDERMGKIKFDTKTEGFKISNYL